MLNGIAGAGAVCCNYSPDSGGGYGTGSNTSRPITVGGVQINVPTGQGILQRVGEAFNNAVHGGDSVTPVGANSVGSSAYSNGANVIPFPMVNPFKPVVTTGAPVTALTRWPKRFTRTVRGTGGEPDDEQSSFDGLSGLDLASGNPGVGLGSALDELPPPPPVPVYRPSTSSTLQTILGTIQATLPATIQAIRAQPSNIFPGTAYGPYATNAGGSYPGTQQAPEGYYYDQTGSLRKIGSAVGGAVGNVGQSLMDFVRTNPLLVLGGGAALVLLFMNPPRRR